MGRLVKGSGTGGGSYSNPSASATGPQSSSSEAGGGARRAMPGEGMRRISKDQYSARPASAGGNGSRRFSTHLDNDTVSAELATAKGHANARGSPWIFIQNKLFVNSSVSTLKIKLFLIYFNKLIHLFFFASFVLRH